VHIPFCVKKCPYCDFYSTTDLSIKDRFVDALLAEIVMADLFAFDTLYIGGGTPSVLKSREIGQIVEAVYAKFKVQDFAEVTVEVNPGTVTYKDLKEYKAWGVNRISIGAQSFRDRNLEFLGRIHSAKDSEIAIKNARDAGFDNISIDLIYGLERQTKKNWVSDLERALEFNPEHISCYTLTYEPDTPMGADVKKGRIKPLDDNITADMFETTAFILKNAGFIHYEISNFAKSDKHRSRHNQKYWSSYPYLGFGPSAHSFMEPERFWNIKDVKEYIQKINSGIKPVEKTESLNLTQRITETIYLGLRTSDGINIVEFEDRFNINFEKEFSGIIAEFKEQGFLEIREIRCRLSLKGLIFQEGIASRFICHDF